jgi:DNA-binding NarL/FixJ family response regulator
LTVLSWKPRYRIKKEWSLDAIKVLIVDDQELFAAGLRIILEESGRDSIRVSGIATNGKEAIQMVDSHQPDVILMDVRMPVMDGVEATKIIHQRYPEKKILVLTTFDDDQYVFDALSNGALGYILKNIRPDELITSIKAVNDGNFFVSQTVGYKLVQQATEGMKHSEGRLMEYHGELNFLHSCFEDLSNRETEILQLLLQDLDNREIAERLFIAEQTVRNYISSIYAKIGVSDRIHAKKLAKSKFPRNPVE